MPGSVIGHSEPAPFWMGCCFAGRSQGLFAGRAGRGRSPAPVFGKSANPHFREGRRRIYAYAEVWGGSPLLCQSNSWSVPNSVQPHLGGQHVFVIAFDWIARWPYHGHIPAHPACSARDLFSGGAQSARDATGASRWRPYQVIMGLVISFSILTLAGSFFLALVGLPQDVLRYAGIVGLVLIGVGLIIPRFEEILEKPFSWIPQRRVGTEGNGLVLGIALGAVYVPCAGPVLAAITVAGSTGRIGPEQSC